MIRPALPEDAEAIARIHHDAWRVAYRGIVPDPVLDGLSFPSRYRWWAKYLKSPERIEKVFVAAPGRVVCGFVSVGPARDDDPAEPLELYALYVAPDQWSRGLGGELFHAAARALRELGGTGFYLWVLAGNIRARRFYEAMGGCPADRAPRDLKMGGEWIPEMIYRFTPAMPEHGGGGGGA